MKRLTRKDALEECKKQWLWMANNPGRKKKDYFDETGIKEIPRFGCYACEYDKQHEDKFCYEKCIIDWGEGRVCFCGRAAYDEWRRAKTLEESRNAALKIVKLCE